MEFENYKYDKVKTSKDHEKDKESLPVSYIQLYKFSTIFDRILLVFAAILAITCGVFEILFSFVFGRCVEAIANFDVKWASAANGTEKLELEVVFMSQANQFAVDAGCIAFVVFFSFYASTTIFNYTATRQTFKIRNLYFYQMINQDIPWHDQSPTGDFANRITEDLRKINDAINDKASMTLYYLAVIVAGIIQALYMGWKLSLICLAVHPILFLIMSCINKLSTTVAKDESEVYGKAGKVADETLSHIKTVTAFGGQGEETKRYDGLLDTARKNNLRKYFFFGLTNGVTFFFMNVSVSLAVWFGVRFIIDARDGDGDYSLMKLVTIYNSIILSISSVGSLTPFLATFNSAKGAASKIFTAIQEKPVINKSYGIGKKVKNLKGYICFEDVHFSYPSRKSVKVLKNFNLKIRAGEKVALVGSSGCGKSTIVQLIQRFYDPDHGRIYIDDVELKNFNLASLRSCIGLVDQEPVLFDGSIADNIRLGNLHSSHEEVEEAAKKSNAHSFITSFHRGYKSAIGERGAQLSGGQKQRIAIARALVRKPAILLLDEATSALDSKSEALVQETLDKVSKDCTTIIVAHKLASVRKADRIVVLDNGSIVEEGSHDDLMASQGVYYKLVNAQISNAEEKTIQITEFEETAEFDKPKNSSGLEVAELKDAEKKSYNLSIAWKVLYSNLFPKWYMAVGIICSVAYGVGMMYTMVILGRSLSAIAETDAEYSKSEVSKCVIQFLLTGVVIGVSCVLQAYLIGAAAENLTVQLRSSMFKTIVYQEIGWFDQSENGVGSLGSRLSEEPSSVQNAIGLCTGPFLNVITMLVILVCIGLTTCWKLLLGFFGFLPFLLIIVYLEQKVLVEENWKDMEILEKSTKLAVEAIKNVRVVASLAIEKVFHARYLKKLKAHRHLKNRNIHVQGIVYGLSRGSLTLSYIITMFYGSHLIKNGDTNAAAVIGITEVFSTTIVTIAYTLAFFPNVIRGFVSCNKIYDMISGGPQRKGSLNKEKVEGDVQYKFVSFSYPTRPNTKVLDGLELAVPKGKTIALVGPSGCGKSTAIQLLMRFYDATSGEITFGGEDITKIGLGALRASLGIVMQEPNLFSRTIGENIVYGTSKGEISKLKIIEAAKRANIHSFIASLPLGYDTFLGERGTQLSGGQKQRIAIARALVRDPEVLLLDEATSALDAESEKVVQEALNRAREERTCIVIAHRLKTIEDADLIIVLNEGKVVEKGTHVELLESRGLYWNLYNLQQDF